MSRNSIFYNIGWIELTEVTDISNLPDLSIGETDSELLELLKK
jgi:hypothetical protein